MMICSFILATCAQRLVISNEPSKTKIPNAMDFILYFRDFTLSEYSYGATPMGPILSVNRLCHPCAHAAPSCWECKLHTGIWLFSPLLFSREWTGDESS